MAESMFEGSAPQESKFERFLRWAILSIMIPFLISGGIAGHRAYFQLRQLEIYLDSTNLHPGALVRAEALSSGRVPVTVSLQIVQGRQYRLLDSRIVPASRQSFFDPRTVPGALSVVVTPEMLAPFTPGPALLRATLRGRPQWMREPPPLLREINVRITKGDSPHS
jgi:hypothetical protein